MKKEGSYPFELSHADIYYIYPFVFDLQPLPFDLDLWIRGKNPYKSLYKEFPLQKGLPESRLGYLPLLPYKTLERRFGHCKWEVPRVELVNPLGKRQTTVSLEKTFTIRECGNGMLTYKFSVPTHLNSSQGSTEEKEVFKPPPRTPLNLRDLQSVFRLVPRMDDKELRNQECFLRYEKTHKITLFDDVKDLLYSLEDRLKGCFNLAKNDDKFLWEDRKVLSIERKHEREKERKRSIVQPYSLIVLYLSKSGYEVFRRHLSCLYEDKVGDNLQYQRARDLMKRLLAIIYRFWELGKYDLVDLENINLRELAPPLPDNRQTVCFFYHTSVLAIVDGSGRGGQYIKKYFIPALIASVEFAVSKTHFALILDALLDDLFRGINKMLTPPPLEALKKLEGFKNKVLTLQMQAALALEEISKYVRTGYVGAKFTQALRKVFQTDELVSRIATKMNLIKSFLSNIEWIVQDKKFSKKSKFL